tara:strand:+ start:897 stop:1160 length:264 start_codon:yes stop_codon:yes gene_type:complete
MELKYSKQFQKKLENIFPDIGYKLRFEKGNFKSGFCILKNEKVVIINKYYTTEGKINTIIKILNSLNYSSDKIQEENLKILNKIKLI